jgi:hypothetical protein
MAHRCAEWDGWEEGLVDSFLGSGEDEEGWFKDLEDEGQRAAEDGGNDTVPELVTEVEREIKLSAPIRPATLPSHLSALVRVPLPPVPKRHLSFAAPAAGPGMMLSMPPSLLDSTERSKEKMLDGTGDICGGRGGELGRRLEAWLCASATSGSEMGN